MRSRLASLSWFMKCLKEPVARMANAEDGCTGAFWEGRFKSVAITEGEALLATAAYIDLNPTAAGVAPTPEDSTHTSLRERLDHCRSNGAEASLRDDLSTLTRDPAQEDGLWLLPINDDRQHGGKRAGLHDGLTLSCYLRFVDGASRMVRAGKTSLEVDLAPIFQRLSLEQFAVEATVNKLFQPRGRVPNRLMAKGTQPSRPHARRMSTDRTRPRQTLTRR